MSHPKPRGRSRRLPSLPGGRRGSALVTVLLLLLALSVIGISMMALSLTNLQIADNQRHGTTALFTAEAGVNEAVHRMGLKDPTNVTVGGTTMNAAIQDPSTPPNPGWKAFIFRAPPGSVPSSGNPDLLYTGTVQDPTEYLEYGSSADTSEAIRIEHKWYDVNGNGVRETGELVLYDARRSPPQNLNSGDPVEVVTVPGRDANGRRTIKAEVTRYPLAPNVVAAVLCDNGVDVTGNSSICGHNHSINTPAFTMINACNAWRTGSGDLYGVITTGDDVQTSGSSDLQGEPAVIDTSSNNPFHTLAEALGITQDEVDDILANADYTSTNDASPLDGIVYVNGDATGTEKFNSQSGTGLIYVDGDMDISGGFVWKGLVYVEGDLTIAGTAWVLGGFIVKGTSTYSFSGGNPAILYSNEAIRYYLSRSLPYVRLAWRTQ
jgi:hypothetical protein